MHSVAEHIHMSQIETESNINVNVHELMKPFAYLFTSYLQLSLSSTNEQMNQRNKCFSNEVVGSGLVFHDCYKYGFLKTSDLEGLNAFPHFIRHCRRFSVIHNLIHFNDSNPNECHSLLCIRFTKMVLSESNQVAYVFLVLVANRSFYRLEFLHLFSFSSANVNAETPSD